MDIEITLSAALRDAIRELFNLELGEEEIQLQKTRKEFAGDFTFVVFPLVSKLKISPEEIGKLTGEYLLRETELFEDFNVIKGFLNLSLTTSFWSAFLEGSASDEGYGRAMRFPGQPILIEYSSPNTNKPLHLGHIRNNLLGASLANILEASGHEIIRVNLVNDRGIHICKSMLAWQRWGKGETPGKSGVKGDHLVGKYYVIFDRHYKMEVGALRASGMSDEEAVNQAPLMLEAQEMLRRWEAGDPEVMALWRMMNDWVYEGFAQTYERLGIRFDHTFYESETYLLGRALVMAGLEGNHFNRRDDGSVWADLTDDGLDEKILLRSDGTSVYITQDLGTAHQRHERFQPSRMIYVVGNEQNYHFDVLKHLLRKLSCDWWDRLHHFSYGMVELPQGKMKSREGTVVDADDLLDEMYSVAKITSEALGKIDEFTTDEADRLYKILSLGALKFFILKVDPKKNMLFNPEESIDFNGHTGPFIQYTHARIQSLIRKAGDRFTPYVAGPGSLPTLLKPERDILRLLQQYPSVLKLAGTGLSPALIANFVYELAKEYNHFYQEVPVLKEKDEARVNFRLSLSAFTARIIQKSMAMLGIEVPERM